MSALSGRRGWVSAAVVVLAAMAVLPAARAQLFHPDASPRPAFEVATIKPSNDAQPGLMFMLSAANFRARQATLKDLLKIAYNVRSDDQFSGLSGWMTAQHFDIQAKASDADIAALNKLGFKERLDEIRLMVQSLLADRFALRVSVKTAELPVYALVVAKGGPKMKEVELSPLPPPGTASPPGAHRPHIGPSGPNQYTAGAWPMSQMADWLGFFDEIGNRVVVDETGLKGYYDFVLNGVSQRFPGPANFNGVEAQDPPVSIFSALPDQLGLKLEPGKAAVEVLVIDHVEQPSAN